MNTLEKEFIPYEQALELKELGFNEPCMAIYYSKDKSFSWHHHVDHTNDEPILDSGEFNISAPLYQQAFRWFREKYELRNSITDFIEDETGIEWDYEIAIIGTDIDERGNYKPLIDYSTDDETRKFKTYEEAELACLRKLIELIKRNDEKSSHT